MESVSAVHVYGDPLDPRGWGSEPAIRWLRASLPTADWSFHPVVLFSDWSTYDGPEFPGGLNTAAAVCSRVSERSGMPIDEYLWFETPPASSAPACRGVFAAAEQGCRPCRRFLRACREATFLRRRNLDSETSVVDLAASVDGVDADALTPLPEIADVTAAVETDVSSVSGVEPAGNRPTLPTVVVRGTVGEQGVSGYVDVGTLSRVVETATGATPEAPTLSVGESIERYSSEGWLSVAELSTLAGIGYDDVVTLARETSDVVEREFASEPFFRAASRTHGTTDGENGLDE